MHENGVSKPAPQPEETERSPAQPVYCQNQCGFFGSPERRNLCSKCFRDALKAEAPVQNEQVSDASTATSSHIPAGIDEPAQKKTQEHDCVAADSPSRAIAVVATDVAAESAVKTAAKKNRCGVCRRKLRLAQQFSCRCEANFCSTHRYPDSHDCGFDFKAYNQKQLSKANPVVVASKINKI